MILGSQSSWLLVAEPQFPHLDGSPGPPEFCGKCAFSPAPAPAPGLRNQNTNILKPLFFKSSMGSSGNWPYLGTTNPIYALKILCYESLLLKQFELDWI